MIFYIDEAGDTGALPSPPEHNSQPVLVIGGIFVDSANLFSLTREYMKLKETFFTNEQRMAQYLDWVLTEIKGERLRRSVIYGIAREYHHAIGFLEQVVAPATIRVVVRRVAIGCVPIKMFYRCSC